MENKNGKVQLNEEQLGDLAQLRHIRNLLMTVNGSLDHRFTTAVPDGINAIRINTERALQATINEIRNYHTKEA